MDFVLNPHRIPVHAGFAHRRSKPSGTFLHMTFSVSATIPSTTRHKKKGGLMLLSTLAAASLVGCGLFQPQPAEQQQEAKGLSTRRDILLHGIVAGTTFQSNQGFTLQNGSSLHANTGLILNSRNIVTNGGQVSSTANASCADNSGLGFCLNGKPKTVAPIIVIPKPDTTAIRSKYSKTPSNTIQGTLNLNSSSDISNRFDNKVTQIKGSLNLNTLATIKNATIIVDETLNSNQGITLENSRILVKQSQLNQTTTLTNSRIISSEDLTVNGKLENNQNSSLVSSKNITTNQAVNSQTGELAIIANLNITTNQSHTGKISLWAGGNITTNQSSRLEGSITAGGAIRFNQGVILTRVLQHSNDDVLGGGSISSGELGVGGTFQSNQGIILSDPNRAIKNSGIVTVKTISQEESGYPIDDPIVESVIEVFSIEASPAIAVNEDIGEIEITFPVPNTSEEIYMYDLMRVVSVTSLHSPGKTLWRPNTRNKSSYDIQNRRIRGTSLTVINEPYYYAIVKRKASPYPNLTSSNNIIATLQQANQVSFTPQCQLGRSNSEQALCRSFSTEIETILSTDYNNFVNRLNLTGRQNLSDDKLLVEFRPNSYQKCVDNAAYFDLEYDTRNLSTGQNINNLVPNTRKRLRV